MECLGTMSARQLVDILVETLSLVDARLSNHGGRVAGSLYPVLLRQGKYTREQMRDICLAAILHDVGAYKTEEIDEMIRFETVDIWAHSIYGHLFIKEMSPLAHLAPVILFHHAGCDQLRHLHPSYHELAQMFHIADRLDILTLMGGKLDRDRFHAHFNHARDEKYRGDLLDLFADSLFGPEAPREDFRDLFSETCLDGAVAARYLNMVVLSIDFRSSQTVTHTVAAVSVARAMAELAGMSQRDSEDIILGTMLHDLGKQGIPPEILESTARLSPKAMEVMKSHVTLTDNILSGNIHDTVRRIAVRHHEKLDGSGYPAGLKAEALTPSERLVAVADIFSALTGNRSYKDAYPREKVTAILRDLRDDDKLDPALVDLALDDYEYILSRVDETSAAAVEKYNEIGAAFRRFSDLMESLDPSDGLVVPESLEWPG